MKLIAMSDIHGRFEKFKPALLPFMALLSRPK